MKIEKFPVLENNHIILREFNMNDFNDYFEYVSDEKIRDCFSFNYTIETAKRRLEELVKLYTEERKPRVWAIELKSEAKVIGAISIDEYSSINRSISIALGIISKYTKKSHGLDALKLLIKYAFQEMNIHRIVLTHELENIVTSHLCEKLNFTYEGIARESKNKNGLFVDRKVYSLLKEELDF